MKNTVYLICGVSGAGKTWVCTQLTDKFNYVPHDKHFKNIVMALVDAGKASSKPLITECPFGERHMREMLERFGFNVQPVFVIEKAKVVAKRYLGREGKPISKAPLTRSASIIDRANEWKAKHGTSEEILKYLSELVL